MRRELETVYRERLDALHRRDEDQQANQTYKPRPRLVAGQNLGLA